MPNALLQAEVLPAAEYSAAQPDPLRDSAALLVDQMNTQRAEDVLRIAARAGGVTIEQMEHAQARVGHPCGPVTCFSAMSAAWLPTSGAWPHCCAQL